MTPYAAKTQVLLMAWLSLSPFAVVLMAHASRVVFRTTPTATWLVFMVLVNMLSVGAAQGQILNPVVVSGAVDVVDDFVSAEHSPEMLRHDQSVFQYIAVAGSHRVVTADFDSDIAVPVPCLPTTPRSALFAGHHLRLEFSVAAWIAEMPLMCEQLVELTPDLCATPITLNKTPILVTHRLNYSTRTHTDEGVYSREWPPEVDACGRVFYETLLT